MHIHGAVQNVQGANFNRVSNGERAAAAQRAAEVRKRLLKAGKAGSDEPTPDETLIGQWLDSRHSQVLSGQENRDAEAGRNPDFG